MSRPADVVRAEPDWFERFFAPIVLDVMENERGADAARREAEFLRSRLNLQRGTRALDVMCGRGRLAVALARSGMDVTGVDLNAAHLREARRRAASEKVSVRFVKTDARSLRLRGFDVAVWNLGSFGYFDDHENERALGRVAAGVGRGGFLAIEVENRDVYAHDLGGASVRRRGRVVVRERWAFDHPTSRVVVNWRIGATTRAASIRVYALHEVYALLERARCDLVDLYGSAEGARWSPASPVHYVVASRR